MFFNKLLYFATLIIFLTKKYPSIVTIYSIYVYPILVSIDLNPPSAWCNLLFYLPLIKMVKSFATLPLFYISTVLWVFKNSSLTSTLLDVFHNFQVFP